METTIKRKVKGSVMEKLFDHCDEFSVRYYAANDTIKDYNENECYNYVITIRHPEDTDAGKLFDIAVIIEQLPENLLLDGDWKTREVHCNGQYLNPAISQKVRNHSPDGHNWSYSGSGPAQLALSILLKFIPKEQACNWYQDFKFKVIAGLPQADFEVTINLKEEIKKINHERNKKEKTS